MEVYNQRTAAFQFVFSQINKSIKMSEGNILKCHILFEVFLFNFIALNEDSCSFAFFSLFFFVMETLNAIGNKKKQV